MASLRTFPDPRPDRIDLAERLREWSSICSDSLAYTYLLDGEARTITWTYAELDARARAIATRLVAQNMAGKRALLLYPPGLDFVAALFGCFYAGVIAVPVFPPRRNRNMARIQAISEDAQAELALTVFDVVDRVGSLLDEASALESLHWFATDRLDIESADSFDRRETDVNRLAILQYTSGSTGVPKGVMLTHSNILNNCCRIAEAFETSQDDVAMSWLPTYHDMGLVGGILVPLYVGRPSILMSPMAFLQSPVRWLKAIDKYQVQTSGGPNFAYDVCTKNVADEDLAGLDLSSWQVAFNGAEPVRASTLEGFYQRFSRCGFRREAFYPCYGMAESTLMITGGWRQEPPVLRSFHGKKLDAGEIVPLDEDALESRVLTGCGRPLPDETVMIVDPERRVAFPEHRVGEIWVSGPSIGQGYLNKRELSEEVFGATLAAQVDLRFLRTGDLGFVSDGHLFVTGRIKDLIIVRGVNYYPQDIEVAVEHADRRVRTGAAAAFAVEIDGRERLMVVCEVERVGRTDWAPVLDAIRANVTTKLDVGLDAVVLVRGGSIAKTSSGKIQRHACRRQFLSGDLLVVAEYFGWEASGELAGGRRRHAGRNRKGAESPANLASVARIGRNGHGETLEIVFEQVRAVARERAGELTAETNLLELGLDSLERTEIANLLARSFDSQFPEELLYEFETCGEVAKAVEQHLGTSSLRTHGHATEVPAEYYDFAQMPEYRQLQRNRSILDSTGLPNPYFTVHEGVASDTTVIAGRQMVNFCSYNYLGMSGDPLVGQAAEVAIRQYGTSVSASRLVSGERPVHQELERSIADFLGSESALVFVGGHATNETTIGHLLGAGDLILHDALAHNSVLQGAILSGAQRRSFPHNDWQALDGLVAELRHQHRRVLVVLEGVYSMDGDYPELPRFVDVRNRHKALLMVDEAHSLGTMGRTGRGLCEHFGVSAGEVDILMGTFSKSLGSCGGYIAGRHELIEYLKYTAPGFVYSVGMPPSNAAAALAALRVLVDEPDRVACCRARSKLFLDLAREHGLNVGTSHGTPIVPVIVGNSRHALSLSQRLHGLGINVQPIMYPAVEESEARLRFFITSRHSDSQVRRAVETVCQQLDLIDPSCRSKHGAASG